MRSDPKDEFENNSVYAKIEKDETDNELRITRAVGKTPESSGALDQRARSHPLCEL